MKKASIIGAGLAGCECALHLADCGFEVTIYEQKPAFRSAAHKSDYYAELVCSNSLRSNERTSAIGLLKSEMRQLGSYFMRAADECRLPAGKALAVDREKFSQTMSAYIQNHENITVSQHKITKLDELNCDAGIKIIAAGPMADSDLMADICRVTGAENCFFYDAIAPIIWTESINMGKIFRASRYEDGDGDYLNCPMSREEFENFYLALLSGKTFQSEIGEEEKHFEGCMPIESLAARGSKTLVFGPLKPVGLVDPATGKRPWAVLQLRPEAANLETCNLVGCQTKLLQSEQERIFRMIPGLENVEFARYGSMHRNTYLNAPEVLDERLALRNRKDFHVIGQLTGVEGYVESAATGLWLALDVAARQEGKPFDMPPVQTALGSLLGHMQRKSKNFQPSNATFGLMPEVHGRISKRNRKEKYAERAEESFNIWKKNLPVISKSMSS